MINILFCRLLIQVQYSLRRHPHFIKLILLNIINYLADLVDLEENIIFEEVENAY